jgi:penicillin-binding protein 2
VAIAGKTGTAETGGEQGDHSWFAGYVPADAPRYAFVVVLQHAGSGSEAAGPIARNVVERLRELGYLGASDTADKSFPPGKG